MEVRSWKLEVCGLEIEFTICNIEFATFAIHL
jgi:hypothetical protein